MKLVYMGTPQLAQHCLEQAAQDHEIVAVVTQPDKRGGRGNQLLSPPVKQWAAERGIPVLQPERARNEEFVAELAGFQPDAIAVVAYGQILPQSILDMAPRGCVNLHFSLLPRWRGAAPVQYAIWNGDQVTGVSTQHMAQKLDAGDLIEQVEVPIDPDENSGQLLERLTLLGAEVLRSSLKLMEDGVAPRLTQEESAVTMAPQISREMALLDWNAPATHLHNVVRAMNPWPAAWFTHQGAPVKVWSAAHQGGGQGSPGTIYEARGSVLTVATGEGLLRLLEVQPPGKPRMGAADWARGARLEPGTVLT